MARPAPNFWKDGDAEDPVANNHPPLFAGLNTRETAVLNYAEELAAGKADLVSGHVPVSQLAAGTPNGTKFVRDDGTLAVPAGAGSGAATVTTIPASGASQTLTAPIAGGEAAYDVTLTANCTFTPDATATGVVSYLTVLLRQGGSGSHEASWPGSVTWPYGDPPLLSTEVDAADLITLFSFDGGTSWMGTQAVHALAPPPPPSAPNFTVDPVITGTGVVGDTLMCDGGTAIGTATITKTYQWKNAGVAISGATASAYVVQAGDVGDALTCTVTASNGVSPDDTATSNTITGAASPTAPGQVTGLGATAGDSQVALAWTAPASNGGSAITTYLVEYRTPAGSGAYTTFTHSASTTPSITVTGLTNGSQYEFRVSAVNAIGTGTASATATATPAPSGSSNFAQMTNPAPGLLTAVTAEVGGPITMHPASGGSTPAVVTAAHRVRSNDALDTYYTFAGTPPSADYTVTADITRLIATVGYAGVLFRWDPTLLTGYVFRLGASGTLGQWECYRYNAGIATQMGAPVPATGSIDVAQGISLTGSGADIVASVGGVGEIFNVTDGAPILTAGKAGIFFYLATTDTNGTQLSNFAAT